MVKLKYKSAQKTGFIVQNILNFYKLQLIYKRQKGFIYEHIVLSYTEK